MLKFDKLFTEELIKEIPVISIGVFPGKFKPPHKGHFKTAETASKENKIVFVLISDREHEGYTADQSLEIWSIYKKYLPNIEPYIVTKTPLAGTYELLNILNNGGDFVATKTSTSPTTNILDVVQTSNMLGAYLNKGNNFSINMYSSPEDKERYRNVKPPIYTGKNIVSVEFRPVDRLTSATQFRNALKSKDISQITRFLPEKISQQDKKQIINILQNATV